MLLFQADAYFFPERLSRNSGKAAAIRICLRAGS